MNTKDNDATQLQINDDATKLPTNDDATQLATSDDATQLSDSIKPAGKKVSAQSTKSSATSSTIKERGKMAKKAGAFAAGGILLGGASSFYFDMKGSTHAASGEVQNPEDAESQEGIMLPEAGGVESIAAAESPAEDEMTFDEAFANARAEQGPGGSFEWKGNVYATYTKEEWDGMNDDEKSDFYEQINMPNPHSETQVDATGEASSADTAGHHETEEQQEHQDETTVTPQPTEGTAPDGEGSATDGEGTAPGGEGPAMEALPEIEGVDIVGVEAPQPEIEGTAIVGVEDPQPEIEGVDIVTVEAPLPEIEMEGEIQILGVEHNAETGANYGTLNIDGQEVFVVDVDGDMVFDAMAADINQDGVIDDDEIMNIHDFGMTVEGLGGYTDSDNEDPMGNGAPIGNTDPMGNDMYASNEEGPDYMSELMNDC